ARRLGQSSRGRGRYAAGRRVLRVGRAVRGQDRCLCDLRVQAAAELAEEEEIHLAMVRLFPEDAHVKAALGAIRVRRGDQAGSRQVLEPLTVAIEDEIRGLAHVELARGYFQENQYAAALRHLEAAGQSDPQVLADAATREFKARVDDEPGHTAGPR